MGAKHMFVWRKDCDCLRARYFQHSEDPDGPICLEPACAEGPYKDPNRA